VLLRAPTLTVRRHVNNTWTIHCNERDQWKLFCEIQTLRVKTWNWSNWSNCQLCHIATNVVVTMVSHDTRHDTMTACTVCVSVCWSTSVVTVWQSVSDYQYVVDNVIYTAITSAPSLLIVRPSTCSCSLLVVQWCHVLSDVQSACHSVTTMSYICSQHWWLSVCLSVGVYGWVSLSIERSALSSSFQSATITRSCAITCFNSRAWHLEGRGLACRASRPALMLLLLDDYSRDHCSQCSLRSRQWKRKTLKTKFKWM